MSNSFPSYRLTALSNNFVALEEIFKTNAVNKIDTCIPCEVVAVNNQFVDVKPVLQNITTTQEVLPVTAVYHNIPMMTIFGNNCEISVQAKIGDRGLLIASKYDISKYKETHTESPKNSTRLFSFSDGFFLPLDFKEKQEGVIVRNGETILQLLPDSVNITTTNINCNCTNATITADSVNLGGSDGDGVARLGDSVEVEITSGSSAGTWTGTITSASEKVKSI